MHIGNQIKSHSECSIEENTKYSGHNLYTTKGRKVGNMAGCASLCFEDSKCKFWTYNPRFEKVFDFFTVCITESPSAG